MIEWPKDGKPLDFEFDLVKPIVKAIHFAYYMDRKNEKRSIPWTGPEIGEDEQANGPLAKVRLKAANLKYCEEDQGRDALEEIVGLAIQLGIEQGRRIFRNSSEYSLMKTNADIGRLVFAEKPKIVPE